jgi:hypothetical protein
MPAPAASAAATPFIHFGYVQAAAAAALLLAALASTAATGFPARKRLAWETWLDMPVGLTAPQAAGTGTACRILLGEPGLRHPGPYEGGAEQGWLVVLGITNAGLAAVRGGDFRAPLGFAFPGRRVHATQILPGPAARTPGRSPRVPAVRVPAQDGLEASHAGTRTTRVQPGGDFLFRPGDSCCLLVVLAGTPAGDSRRIQQEGSLAGGKIIRCPVREPGST